MKHTQKHHSQPGHILIAVLLLMLIGVFAITVAATMVVTTTQSQGARLESSSLRSAAESGVENAILGLLRSPSSSGSAITVDGIAVTTVVVPGSPSVITATAVGDRQRHVYRATVDRVNGMLSITSWTQVE